LTGEPRELGAIRCYDDLHAILRNRCEQLELSCEALDDRAGLQSGYAGKLLAPAPIKRASFDLLGLILPALGLRLIAIADDAMLARFCAAIRHRAGNKRSAAVLVRFSRRYMQRIGRKGGRNSRKNMTKAKARALGRRAGKASAMARANH
jgi:general stress protein YciG